MQMTFADFCFRVLFTLSHGKEARDLPTLEITLGPKLTAKEAQAIYEQGPAAVVIALLQMAKLRAEQQRTPGDSPSTHSGMKPVYHKQSLAVGFRHASLA